ncbi:sialate O-acetylesterase [Rhodoflexus sp.]
MKSTIQLIFWFSLIGAGLLPLCSNAQKKAREKPVQQLRVAAIFGDNMVLQRGKTIPIWGWGVPGQPVSVQIGNRLWKEKTDKVSGRWQITIDSLPVGSNYRLLVMQPQQDTVLLHNVAVGEVWLCSGQSNMEWQVRASQDAEREIAAANYPLIRHVKIVHNAKLSLQDSLQTGGWQTATPPNVAAFSAVAYAFARHLHDSLKVPIGLINSTWGGTQIESWISRTSLSDLPGMTALFARTPAASDTRTDSLIRKNPNRYPSVLYNAMIHPLIPFALRGVIWYQGETNAARAVQYREMFPALIADWRKQWGQELPFLFVQLANWKAAGGTSQNGGSEWAELREAQQTALKLPLTGMVVTIDIGDSQDIHPRNKQEVGRRLALNALSIVYRRNIQYSSPFFAEKILQDETLMLYFKNTYGKLMVKNDRYGYVRGFEVAGSDGYFFPAQARIVGNDRIILSCDRVSRPEYVRYAWADDPADANVFNAIGLPLAPFRTDELPEKTAGKKFSID